MVNIKKIKNAIQEWEEFEKSGYTHSALPTSSTLSIIKDALNELLLSKEAILDLNHTINALYEENKQYREFGTIRELEEIRKDIENMANFIKEKQANEIDLEDR